MTADISISLNVVNIAAVCWTSTRRFAIVFRRRDILIRSSGFPGAAAGAGAGVAGFVGAGFACSRGATSNVATSCTRIRPSGSCVATCAKSIPLSRASLRAAGEAIGRSATDVLSVAAAATGCSAFSSAFGVSFGVSCTVSAAAGFGASPPAEMTAIVSPTRTVSPSAAITSVNVPASSDGTSMLTLSVSSSTMASPFST